ncbi:MAG: DUF4366 domain-containing protein, partial [Eubacterium sp.]|nr:DUF4366 domain-containing protein [Eubacterium sp.]
QEKKEVKDGSSEDKNSTSDPFTSIGNAEVRDDITDGSTKEFLTIVTKNNQTFYIVIDRSSTTDNVYMLSNIDENDLAEFLSETSTEEASTETPAIVLPELTREEEETTAAEGTEQKEEEKSGFVSGMSWMGIILLAAAVAFAAALYLKVIRPRNEAEEDPGDEGLEAASYEEVDEDAR